MADKLKFGAHFDTNNKWVGKDHEEGVIVERTADNLSIFIGNRHEGYGYTFSDAETAQLLTWLAFTFKSVNSVQVREATQEDIDAFNRQVSDGWNEPVHVPEVSGAEATARALREHNGHIEVDAAGRRYAHVGADGKKVLATCERSDAMREVQWAETVIDFLTGRGNLGVYVDGKFQRTVKDEIAALTESSR